MDAELVVNIAVVFFNRVQGNEKLVGNGLIGMTPADQAQDIQFPYGQRLQELALAAGSNRLPVQLESRQ